jgi:hypothetical protein
VILTPLERPEQPARRPRWPLGFAYSRVVIDLPQKIIYVGLTYRDHGEEQAVNVD